MLYSIENQRLLKLSIPHTSTGICLHKRTWLLTFKLFGLGSVSSVKCITKSCATGLRRSIWGNWGYLGKRKQQRRLTALYNLLNGGFSEASVPLFSLVTRDTSRGNGLKLHQVRITVEKLLHWKVIKHWNRLPMEVIESPWLGVFKRHTVFGAKRHSLSPGSVEIGHGWT